MTVQSFNVRESLETYFTPKEFLIMSNVSNMLSTYKLFVLVSNRAVHNIWLA